MESTGVHAHQQIFRTHQVFSASPSPLVFAYIYPFGNFIYPFGTEQGLKWESLLVQTLFSGWFWLWLFLRQLYGCIKAPIFMWAKVAGGIIPRDDSMELGFICCAHCGGLHVWNWPGIISYPFVFKSTLLRPFECTLHFGLNCEHNISSH